MLNNKNVWWFFAFGIGLILLGIGLVQGFQVDTFDSLQACTNLSMSPNVNHTLNITAYKYATVTQAKINITGYGKPGTGTPYTNVTLYKYGRYVGSYRGIYTYNGSVNAGFDGSPSDLNDGNWGTAYGMNLNDGYANYYYRVNFTYMDPEYNISNSSGVVSYKVNLRADGEGYGNVSVYCENSTGNFNYIDGIYGKGINESAAIYNQTNKVIRPDCFLNNTNRTINFLIVGSFFEYDGEASPNETGSAFYEIETNITNTYVGSQWPQNVTIYANNTIVFYNSSTLNQTNATNLSATTLTSLFSTAATVPLTIVSNASGYIYLCLQNFTYNNTLNVTVYDEETGNIILQNITIETLQNDAIRYDWTTSGVKSISNQFNGSYTVAGYGSNYSKRDQIVVISPGTFGSVSLYLANQSTSVIFTVNDKLTKEPVSGATIIMARIIGSEWEDIASKNTDITGKAVFSYTPNIRYRFTINATGYDEKVYYLDPVIFTSYIVELTPSNQRYYGLDYEDITADIEPTMFYADQINYLNVTIQSAQGLLNSYSISVCYPGGCNTSSGSASSGEILSTWFNITGATTFSQVELNITYNTDVSGTRTFTYHYLVQGATFSQYTWASNRNNPTGAGWIERVLFASFFIIVVAGIITYVAGPLAGGAVALMFLGFAAYLHFIPTWAAIGSILVGIILLGKRAAE